MRKIPIDFQKVVDYLSKRGIYVNLTTTTNFWGGGMNIINIHHKYNLEKNGLFALLHEAGHSLQGTEQFGPNHYKRIDEDEKPKLHNMHLFINEVDAWDRGERLAKRLGIKTRLGLTCECFIFSVAEAKKSPRDR